MNSSTQGNLVNFFWINSAQKIIQLFVRAISFLSLIGELFEFLESLLILLWDLLSIDYQVAFQGIELSRGELVLEADFDRVEDGKFFTNPFFVFLLDHRSQY